MNHHHADVPAGLDLWAFWEVSAALALLLAALGYGMALRVNTRRGPWPVTRSVSWYAGLACVAAGSLGPIASAAHTSFTAHMLVHLLIGMLGPLLLVLGAPVTLLLRALPVASARVVARLLRTPAVRVLTHPAVAAALNAGGLWLLYTTDLYARMHASPVVYALVHLHLVVSGYVLTASLVGVDPDPHRAPLPVRAVVLVAFFAAHAILAKWIYGHPPVGVDPADAQVGAQLMYYGGDVVDIAVIVLLFSGWYASGRVRSAVAQTP